MHPKALRFSVKWNVYISYNFIYFEFTSSFSGKTYYLDYITSFTRCERKIIIKLIHLRYILYYCSNNIRK